MEIFIICCWVISFVLVGLFFYRSIYITLKKESKEEIKEIKRVSDMKYVTLLYSITDTNGKEIDSRYKQEPFTYLHGEGQILAGLEKQLTGLKLGTKKKIIVPVNEAYGEKNPDDIKEVEKSKLGDKEVEVGSFVEELGNGVKPGKVIEVKEDTIIVDSNQPLAGQKLIFNVDIIDIQENADNDVTIDKTITEDIQAPINDIADKDDENDPVIDDIESEIDDKQGIVNETIENDPVIDDIESEIEDKQDTVNETIENDPVVDDTISGNNEKPINDLTEKTDELDNNIAEDEQKGEKEPLVVSDGMEVKIAYSMFETDGNMIESKKDDPITYIHGSEESFSQIIPGLQKKITGLTAGSSINISLLPEEAYGKIDSRDYYEVSKSEIFTDDLRVGIVLKEIGPHKKSAKVHKVKKSTVILDFNHQLAGKALSYNVNILDVKAKQDDQEIKCKEKR